MRRSAIVASRTRGYLIVALVDSSAATGILWGSTHKDAMRKLKGGEIQSKRMIPERCSGNIPISLKSKPEHSIVVRGVICTRGRFGAVARFRNPLALRPPLGGEARIEMYPKEELGMENYMHARNTPIGLASLGGEW